MNLQSSKRVSLAARLGIALAVLAVFGISYVAANRFAARFPGETLQTWVDPLFEHDPRWVWIYYLFFPMLALPFLTAKNQRQIRNSIIRYTAGLILTLPIYILWPTRMVRPTISGDGISAGLMRTLYSGDRPYNCFPSQHVAFSILVGMIALKRNLARGIPVMILAILISLSTLFVKQHWALDVVGGIAVAGLAFATPYIIDIFRRKRDKKCTEDRHASNSS